MKRLLAFVSLLALALPAFSQSYNRFQPANGILKGDTSTYVTTSANSADVRALWSGTCDVTTFLRGDGACASAAASGQALTRTNDTNVTLTLGGTPTTALLQPTSLTLGWTGQLGVSRGGTGVSSLGNLTKTDDTNVTLTLGGTPTGSLINSTSLTLGWTGTLGVSRGGIGVGTLTGIAKGNGTSAFTAAGSSDVIGTWSGTCNSTTFLRGDGSCQTPSGTTSGANPTATIGLTAVNGSAGTFLRSDGAPALSQAIAPTWTQTHTWSSIANTGGIVASSVAPYMSWEETDQGVDAKRWRVGPISSTWSLQTLNDAFNAASTAIAVSRSSNTVSNLTFGNATDNPTFTFSGTGTTTYGGRVNISTDAGANPLMQLTNTNASDGRTVLDFFNNRTTSRQWSLGIDTNGGVTKSFEIRDVTGSTVPLSINTSGRTAFDAGSNTQAMTINSANANGPYVTFARGGVATADIGNGVNCGGSFTSDALCLVGRSGNALQMAAGGRTTPDLQITSAGTIRTNIATVLAGTSAPLRINAADSVGDNYIQAFSSDGTTTRWYVGNGGSADNNVTLNNDVSGGVLNLQTVSGAVNINPNSTTQAAFSSSGLAMAGATGGAQGSGTVNATGLFVNGVAVGTGGGTLVAKGSATDRSSTTALASDPDLQFTAVSGGTYDVQFCLVFGGVSTGTQGFKFAINMTSVGSNNGMWGGSSRVNNAGAAHSGIAMALGNGDTTGQISYATISVGNGSNQVCGQGVISQSGGVTYAVQWAQNSSSANATRLNQGSYIRYTRTN